MAEKTKKTEIIRRWFQACSFALTNSYIEGFRTAHIYKGASKKLCVPGLNCWSCPGARFACPVGALQSVLDGGTYRVSCYVFGLLVLFGTVAGRFVCGWLCPFGLVQDLVYKIPFFRKRKNLPGHRALRFARYAVLALLVVVLPATVLDSTGMGRPWFCTYVCPSGTLFAGIPLVLGNPALRAAAGFLFSWKMCVLLVLLALSLWCWRPFCKYLCPLGAFYGMFNPVAVVHLAVNRETCTSCGACRKACRADISVWNTPDSPDCVRCGRCIDACPETALRFTVRR